MSDLPLSLAGDFPAASRDDWRRLVAGVLRKGGLRFDETAPERALASERDDGLAVEPLYTAADLPPAAPGVPGQAPYVRGARPAGAGGWDVRTRLDDPDPAAANRAALADLAGGASSLWLRFGPDALPLPELTQVLAGVQLELAPVVLDAGGDYLAATREFLSLVAGLEPAAVRLHAGADPVGAAARSGGIPDLDGLAELWQLTAEYPNAVPVTVDGTGYAEAGGTDADELAITLSVAVAYLRAAEQAGLTAAAAFDRIEFRYAVTADQFGSIAKLRAARRLWDRVGELCGLADRHGGELGELPGRHGGELGELPGRRGQRQHAVTSAAMLTRRDPWVNLLRATIGCFAAAVGGAEAVTVLPFDAALGVPDDFGRRIARNTQAILHDESSLARVADPAGGSYYVESLTDRLAAAAWHRFTELERQGGAAAALGSGALAERLETSWQARRRRLADRSEPITGVSEFPLPDEPLLVRPARPGAETEAAGLPAHRYAEEYEALRDASDRQLAETGGRPSVFLAALGPVPAHSARLAFASNLFAAGGVQPVPATGGPAELAAAFTASGCRLACLCGSDASYAEQAAEVAAALKQAGAAEVWIAGKPALAEGDIDRAVHLGCDALARLRAAHELQQEVPA